jgi:hypothetical protein
LNIILLAVGMAVFAFAAVLVGYNVGGGSNATTDTTPDTPTFFTIERQAEPVEVLPTPTAQNNGDIRLLGFDRLTAEGRRLQAEKVHNHADNACHFIVSLMLADGTEIYRSGILAPGMSAGTVELTKQLAPGIYEGAVARFSSYSLETFQLLGGADISFTLEVLP